MLVPYSRVLGDTIRYRREGLAVPCSTGDLNLGKSQPLRYASEAVVDLFNNVYNG